MRLGISHSSHRTPAAYLVKLVKFYSRLLKRGGLGNNSLNIFVEFFQASGIMVEKKKTAVFGKR